MEPKLNHKQKIRECFNKSILTYDEQSIPQQMIGLNLINFFRPYFSTCKNIIDLGCGTGMLTQRFASLLPYENFYAVDLSDQFILKAKDRLKDCNIKLFNEDFEMFQAENILFDLVFSNMSLQWCVDFKKTLSNVYQQLSENGIVAFSVPVEGNFPELMNASKNKLLSYEDVSSFVLAAGFEEIKFSCDTLLFSFETWVKAFKSIKATGANYLFDASKKLNSPKILFDKKQKNPSLTYKIGYFVARKK